MTHSVTRNTHEQYLTAVRAAIIDWARRGELITAEQAIQLEHTKLMYGIGDGSYRGICVYSAWENGIGNVDVIEMAATGQESFVQLAGTLLHEMAHVLTKGDGHGSAWKDAAVKLGFLIRPAAAGQVYHLAMFTPEIRTAVYELARSIGDGSPSFRTAGLGIIRTVTPRPCSVGIGTRGGTSRGKGSGSRLRLWECGCAKPVKVRIASDDFAAHCDRCGEAFKLVTKPPTIDF